MDPKWGAAGLTASAGLAGWVEFALLRHNLNKRIGRTGLPFTYIIKLWFSSFVGAVAAWAVKLTIGGYHPLFSSTAILLTYGFTYFLVAWLLGISELNQMLGRLTRGWHSRALPR
jgi:putative peptidoglycan lipid II flippase